MATLTPNTDALIEWCERHGLKASEIVHEDPYRWQDSAGALHYRFRRVLDPSRDENGNLRWEMVEVVTAERLPPLWDTP